MIACSKFTLSAADLSNLRYEIYVSYNATCQLVQNIDNW